MTTKEKYIVETVALNARKFLIKNNVITEETLALSLKDAENIVKFFGGVLCVNPNPRENRTYIKKTGEETFTIYYAVDAGVLDILHELGHAFFDLPTMSTGRTLDCKGSDIKDIRGALFARVILMPRDIFEEIVIKHSEDGRCRVRDVAKVFNTDVLSVLTRGQELNIWG